MTRPLLTRLPLEELRARYPSLNPMQGFSTEAFCPFLNGQPCYRWHFSFGFTSEQEARQFASDWAADPAQPLPVEHGWGAWWQVYLPVERAQQLDWGYVDQPDRTWWERR
jgi:hypothetical protein